MTDDQIRIAIGLFFLVVMLAWYFDDFSVLFGDGQEKGDDDVR